MASRVVLTFTFGSMVSGRVSGYHEYPWGVPAVGEELICHRELGNSHDPYAVAVKKGSLDTVELGHGPRRISEICSSFIRRGGTLFFSEPFGSGRLAEGEAVVSHFYL